MNSVAKIHEWCQQSRKAPPQIISHTSPVASGLSHCTVEIKWNEVTETYIGVGTSKQASKIDAFDKILEQHDLHLSNVATLKSFCNLKMIEDKLEYTRWFDGTEWNASFRSMSDTDQIFIHAHEESPSQAKFIVMKKLEEHYGNEVYHEPSKQQMEQPAVRTDTTTANNNIGASLTGQQAQPIAPPSDITPHIMAPVMAPEMVTTMVGGPNLPVETPNVLGPADMLVFGGVDFTIKDAAHNQWIDHAPNIAISQAAQRGQIIAIDSYNPFNKNEKIRAWVDLHTRYVGKIGLRYHLIANPIFMGEIAVAWLPDVRHLNLGDIIPDAVFQLYSWKTLSLREGGTQHYDLEDARENKFYRTNDVAGEDLTLTRPGIVVVIYQPMVNPFDNQQASCYLNIGSCLTSTFRVADPVANISNNRPTDPQTPSNNFLEGNSFGSVFSAYGITDAPQVFMSTDGTVYPFAGARTTTPSGPTPSEATVVYPRVKPFGNTSSRFAGFTHEAFPLQTNMENSVEILNIYTKNYGDHSGVLFWGDWPSVTNSARLNMVFAPGTVDEIATRIAESITMSGGFRRLAVGQFTTHQGVLLVPEAVFEIMVGQSVVYAMIFHTNVPIPVGQVFLRETIPMTLGAATAVDYNFPQLSFPTNQQLLRFSDSVFPAVTYTANLPSTSLNQLEQQMYELFNTLTSTSGGFVQFSLFSPAQSSIVAVVRYDHAIGFFIYSTSDAFRQYNAEEVNNLVFRNVSFGNRAIVFPATDTQSWVQRRNPAFSSTTQKVKSSSILSKMIKSGEVLAVPKREWELDEMVQRLNIKDQLYSLKLEKLEEYIEPSIQQAAFAVPLVAGALSGIGGAIGQKINRDYDWQKFEEGYKQKQALQQQDFENQQKLYQSNREADMKYRQEMAGYMAPISQISQSRFGTMPQPRNDTYSGPQNNARDRNTFSPGSSINPYRPGSIIPSRQSRFPYQRDTLPDQ